MEINLVMGWNFITFDFIYINKKLMAKYIKVDIFIDICIDLVVLYFLFKECSLGM